jgi:hypothetical protein
MRAIILTIILCVAWQAAAGGEVPSHAKAFQSGTIDNSQARACWLPGFGPE